MTAGPVSGGSARRPRRLAINTLVGVLSRIVSMVIGFAVTPALLQSLGPEQFGVYAVLGSLVAYFGILDLGIGGSLWRNMTFYSERGERHAVRQIATFGFLFYLALGLILLPAVVLVSRAAPGFLNVHGALAEDVRRLVYIIYGLFIGSSLSGVVGARLVSVHRTDLFMLVSLGSNIVYAGLVIVFAGRFRSVYFPFVCSAAQLAFNAIVSFALVQSIAPRLVCNPFRLSRRLVGKMFNFGAWSQVNAVSTLVNMEADKLVINHFINVEAVTPYQIGNRMAVLSKAIPVQLLVALLPDVTARISTGATPREIAEVYRDGTRILMLATLAISGFVAATAPTFVRAWIGHPVPGAETLAVALVISYSVNNLTGLGTTIVSAGGRPRYEAYYTALSAAANIVLTIVLVPRFGLWGVVGGTILGNVIGSTYFIVIFHQITRFSFRREILSWLAPLVLGITLAGGATRWGVGVFESFGPHERLVELLFLGWAGVFYCGLALLLLALLRFWRPSDYALAARLMERVRPRRSPDGLQTAP